MTAEETRKLAAHEQLNEIADQLAPAGAEAPPSALGGATSAQSGAAWAYGGTSGATQSKPDAAAASPSQRSDVLRPLVLAKDDPRVRTLLITYFPMLIAVLSLVLSLYQGYLFKSSLDLSQRSLDLMERNVARGEFMRTCREISETYFQVKQRIAAMMPAADRGNVAGASRVTEHNRFEAQEAVAKFGGLGTFLANFQDAAARARYTELTRTLTGIMETARTMPLSEADKMFVPADKTFASMNEDCVRLARTTRM